MRAMRFLLPAALLLAVSPASADVILNLTLGAPSSFTAYYPGPDRTIVQTDFLVATGPNMPDLSTATGNLVFNLIAPPGQFVEILATVNAWNAGVRYNSGSLSFVGSVPTTVSFVNPSGGLPVLPSGSTNLFESSQGILSDLQAGLLSTDVLPSGAQFRGISFAIPISAFSSFTQTDLAFFNGLLRLNLELAGDQTATAPGSLAQFSSDVPEPSSMFLLAAPLALMALRMRSQRNLG
ncbi:MAG: hypothetical protein JNL98_12000 [Bryobacterales bacterium]|nr:hypothetical protein [Bryobacterales bacterium]